MAIQNFVAGGFYGKLGAMVGQRWRNKRTLRVWVKGTNPRTEKQQANRGVFGQAVALAQIGNQMNWKAPAFANADNTMWALRMAKARDNQKAGKTGLSAIPLFPIGYEPAIKINKIYLVGVAGSDATFYFESSESISAVRKLSVLLGNVDAESGEQVLELHDAQIVQGVFPSLVVKGVSEGEISETTEFLGVTNEDAKNSNEMIFLPPQLYAPYSPETRAFKVEGANVASTLSAISVVFDEPYLGIDHLAEKVFLKFASGAVESVHTFENVSLVNKNGYYGLDVPFSAADDFHRPAFGTNATVQIQSTPLATPTLRLNFPTSPAGLRSNDITRNCVMFDILNYTTNEVVASQTRYTFDMILQGNFTPFERFIGDWELQPSIGGYEPFEIPAVITGQDGNTVHCYFEDSRLAARHEEFGERWVVYGTADFWAEGAGVEIGGIKYMFTEVDDIAAAWEDPV